MGEVDWSKFDKGGGGGPKVDWDKFDGGAKGKKSIWGQKSSGGGGFAGKLLKGTLDVLDTPRRLVDKTPIGDIADTLRTGSRHGRGRAPGLSSALRNTVVDIAEDPLTYVSFGTSQAAKVGLKAVGKELGKEATEAVVKRGARRALTGANRARVAARLGSAEGASERATANVLRKLDRGGQGGMKVLGQTVIPGRAFSPITAPVSRARRRLSTTKVGESVIPRAAIARSLGRDVADDFGAASSRARSSAMNATAETVTRIERAAKDARVTTDELQKVVLPAIDVGGEGILVPPRLRPLVTDLRSIISETTSRQQAAEILPGAREDYVARFLTPEAKKALGPEDAQSYGVGLSNAPGAVARQAGHVKARTFMPDAPLTQANTALSKALRLEGPAYETNPLLTTAKRAALADKAVAQRHLFDDVAKITDDTGQPILRKAEGKKPLGWQTVDAGPLGTYHAPREVAEQLQNVRAVVTNDEAMAEFSGLLGKLNTAWKAQATVPFVGGFGFHLRNAQGNFFNNFLVGVKNPADYVRAMKLQRGKNLSAADKKLVELARKHGVLNEGFFLHELMDPKAGGGRLGRAAKDQRAARFRAAANPFSTEGVPIRSGRALGSAIENNARMAHFLAKLKELGNADEAARSVKQYLFDYGDLTPFEREKIKKLVPFWTWMRKNVPLQARSVGRQPGKYSAAAHANERVQEGRDMSGVPFFLQDEPYTPFSIGGQQIALRPDLPPFAAVEAVDPMEQTDLGLFGGIFPSLVKYAVEEKTGKSLYTGFNTKGSTPMRLADAVAPLTGKIRRAPYGHKLPTGAGIGLDTDDPQQALARLIAALTGLRSYRTDAQ